MKPILKPNHTIYIHCHNYQCSSNLSTAAKSKFQHAAKAGCASQKLRLTIVSVVYNKVW